MVTYEVYVFCDECSVPHSTRIKVGMADGPADRASIGDVYRGQEVPAQYDFTNNHFQCPTTGKMFQQRDNNQVFLVAVGPA